MSVCQITTRYEFPEICWSEHRTTEWANHTAAEAVKARANRLRAAGSPVTRNGQTLTTWQDRGTHVETTILTFTDEAA